MRKEQIGLEVQESLQRAINRHKLKFYLFLITGIVLLIACLTSCAIANTHRAYGPPYGVEYFDRPHPGDRGGEYVEVPTYYPELDPPWVKVVDRWGTIGFILSVILLILGWRHMDKFQDLGRELEYHQQLEERKAVSDYIGNWKTQTYHHLLCPFGLRSKSDIENWRHFDSWEQMRNQGYKPCQKCLKDGKPTKTILERL